MEEAKIKDLDDRRDFDFYLLNFSFLQWLASGESGFDIMPPLDFIAFTKLPAKQHNAPVAQARKIYQAARIIFDLHADSFHFAGEHSELCQHTRIGCAANYPAAATFGCFRRFARRRLKREQPMMFALNGLNKATHGWQQCVRFFKAKNFHDLDSTRQRSNVELSFLLTFDVCFSVRPSVFINDTYELC